MSWLKQWRLRRLRKRHARVLRRLDRVQEWFIEQGWAREWLEIYKNADNVFRGEIAKLEGEQ